MMYRKLIFVLFMSLPASLLSAQDFALYRLSDSSRITIPQLVQSIQPSSILIFGEQHNDSLAHHIQLQLLQALHLKFGSDVVLSMEMFERDVQPIVDEWLSDLISEKNFIKEARAWNNYADYQPMVQFAKENNLKVVAANTPSRYVNRVTRLGLESLQDLDKQVKKQYLPSLPITLLEGKYRAFFREAMGGHEMPGMHLYESQNLWDATMAWSIRQVLKDNKKAVVYQLNGKFHSDYFSGLAERLMQDSKYPLVTISCVPAQDVNQPNWEQLSGIAHFLILTKQP